MYCSNCGTSLNEGASFCMQCGQSALAVAVPAGAVAPLNAPLMAVPGAASYVRLSYAGFWLRFVASIIDGFVFFLCFIVIMIPLLFLTGVGSGLAHLHPGETPDEVFGMLGVLFIVGIVFISIVGNWLYHALLESSHWQATPGKKLLGLRVTDEQGSHISFGRATGRHFAKMISGLIPFGIGYIIAGFTQKKQAVHDMIASCLVLRND